MLWSSTNFIAILVISAAIFPIKGAQNGISYGILLLSSAAFLDTYLRARLEVVLQHRPLPALQKAFPCKTVGVQPVSPCSALASKVLRNRDGVTKQRFPRVCTL